MLILFVFIVAVVVIYGIIFVKSNFDEDSFDEANLESKLYNGDKLNGYRLADVIFYPDYLTSDHPYSTADHLYRFPDTIGTMYVKRKYPELNLINGPGDFKKHKNEYNKFEHKVLTNLYDMKIDIQLLNQIIKEKGLPQPNFPYSTLLLHVRVGDVLCNYSPTQAHDYSKVGDPVWWNSVLYYILRNKINKVIIISGTHFDECLKESAYYLKTIKDTLEKHANVVYRVGNSPDEDLAFCRHAKHFITTGGGYGYFLGKIVELNGGDFALNKQDTIRMDRRLF
jgi:hypothetical protein